MSAVVAIGEKHRVEGFVLAGVRVFPAEDPDEVRRVFADLDHDVGLIILTPAAASALEAEGVDRPRLLRAVLP